MPIATLRTKPCSWSSSRGCVMCGYYQGAGYLPPSNRQLVAQTKGVIGRLDPQTYPAIVFTSNGSFLDPAEVSDNMRPVLLGMLREAGFQFVVVESRLEYITPTRLQAMVHAFCPDTLNGKQKHRVSVSVGLESSNDLILHHCINKGHVRQDYVKTFELLRREGFSFDCYVLLGKPFLTAEEDISDAVETIRFAVEQGAEYVFVMVLNLMRGTLTAHMAEHGYYELPSLWRAVQLLEDLPHDLRRYVQVKAFERAPVSPDAFATTCTKCKSAVKSGLNFWNQTGDFQHIKDLPRCECRKRFVAHELERKNDEALDDRVGKILQAMAHELATAAPDRCGMLAGERFC